MGAGRLRARLLFLWALLDGGSREKSACLFRAGTPSLGPAFRARIAHLLCSSTEGFRRDDRLLQGQRTPVCACESQVRYLIDPLPASQSHLPGFRMKLRRYRVRVETCDRVTQLPYWLMSFLTQIDACPGLLSLDEPGQSASCQWSCADNLAALPYMHSQQHTNTANYFNPTIKLVPKRFRRALVAVTAPDAASTVLSPLIAAARRRRDRQSTTATNVARRPVTRGVRLPRYDHLQSPIRGNHRILTQTIPLVKVKLESGMVATSPEVLQG